MGLGILKKSALFAIGGASYMGLELLWRGWSHATMFLAGGSCFLLLGQLDAHKGKLPLPFLGLTASGIITAVELATGLLMNGDHHIWDYRHLPLNFRGQICLPFCLLWMPIGLGAMQIYRLLDQKLLCTKEKLPG